MARIEIIEGHEPPSCKRTAAWGRFSACRLMLAMDCASDSFKAFALACEKAGLVVDEAGGR